MAIDTNVSETLKNHTRIKNMRRGGSPEPSCQLPTAPAHTFLMTEEDYIEKKERLIPLTRGYFAIVDEDKYAELIKYKWYVIKGNNTCYAMRYIRLKNPTESIYIYMHAQILGYPDSEIDHKNHNGLDNRICNVRTCTRAQNQHNRKNVKHTSIFKGVSEAQYYKKTGRGKRWMISLRPEGKLIHFYFDDEIEAAKVYDEKALELYGEFAYTNF